MWLLLQAISHKIPLGQGQCARSARNLLGYRLDPGCRWNGEYLVADLSHFVNLDLAEDANAQGIAIRAHVTNAIYLPKEGYTIPMKKRCDHLSSTLEGLRHRFVEPIALPGLVVGAYPDEESGIPSASSDGVEWSGIDSAHPVPVGSEPPDGMPSAGGEVPRDSDTRLAPGEHWASEAGDTQ